MTVTPLTVTDDEPVIRVNTAIRVGMARENLTPTAMANRLDMTYHAFWRRMSGQVAWNVLELAAVAGVLGVDVADLFATA